MEEHERFVQALQLFPAGPWKSIAAVVGTKNPRQTMSHAQKCRQKQERWQRGLKIQSRRSVIATQQPSFIPTPDASSNTNGSQLVQPLPVEEIRCNSVHFSALINEERPVKSHVTSVSVGDAASLTQYWNDVHGGAPGQHQYHHHHHHSLGSVLETVPVFPVFEAFEATEHPAASMWPALIPSSSDGVSSMRLSIPEAGVFADDDGEAREDLLRLFQPRAN
ncbi:Myb-like DNA-binding protein [Globisporangium polare]